MPTVSMTVNGQPAAGEVEGRTLLVEFLREQLRLTGTHVGCDTSQCGACVVHVNGNCSRLIDATAKKMANDFFARFAEAVGGPAPEEAAEIPVPAEEAAPAGAVRPLFWALGVVAIVLVLLAIFGLN